MPHILNVSEGRIDFVPLSSIQDANRRRYALELEFGSQEGGGSTIHESLHQVLVTVDHGKVEKNLGSVVAQNH